MCKTLYVYSPACNFLFSNYLGFDHFLSWIYAFTKPLKRLWVDLTIWFLDLYLCFKISLSTFSHLALFCVIIEEFCGPSHFVDHCSAVFLNVTIFIREHLSFIPISFWIPVRLQLVLICSYLQYSLSSYTHLCSLQTLHERHMLFWVRSPRDRQPHHHFHTLLPLTEFY